MKLSDLLFFCVGGLLLITEIANAIAETSDLEIELNALVRDLNNSGFLNNNKINLNIYDNYMLSSDNKILT